MPHSPPEPLKLSCYHCYQHICNQRASRPFPGTLKAKDLSQMKHTSDHRKVGVGLSLNKFAKAKTSNYDKRKVVQKHMALKAKQINKWRRKEKHLLAQHGPTDGYAAVADAGGELPQHEPQQQREFPPPPVQQQQPQQPLEGQQTTDRPASDDKRRKRQRERSAQQAAEQEQEQQKELQRQLMEQQAKQQREKKRQRSHEKHHFFQRTKRGQPVMKHRVDKILATLQKESAAAGAAAKAGARR